MTRWKRILILIICIILFSLIALYHGAQIGREVDNGVYHFIFSSESFLTTTFFIGITKIGEVYTMAVLSLILVIYLALKHYYVEMLFFVFTMGLSTILNPLLKNIFDRERPTVLRLVEASGYSFPSGHAMGSIAFFGSLIYLAHRLIKSKARIVVYIICTLFILGICSSRIYLGVHYPTDIMAGLLGGGSSLILSTLILRHKLQI